MGNLSEQSKLRLAIIVNVIPSYREGFYDRLFARDDVEVRVYCKDKIVGAELKTIHQKYPNHVSLVNYVSANHEQISWQFIPWHEVIKKYDVVFVEGNPRNLSHALLSTYLRAIGKNIVLWTMAHSFKANKRSENIRLIWSKIFKYLLVYTDAEVKYLEERGFKEKYLVGQNNGLDQKKIDLLSKEWSESKLREWKINNGIERRTVLLSCSRLGAKNKFSLFVESMRTIVTRYPNILWCVIGDGDERHNLELLVQGYGLDKNVRFLGAIYKEEELTPWFKAAEIFIHPAAIGLSILHAFGYGIPVITHGTASHHGPEFVAFEHGKTGLSFREDDLSQLTDAVISLLRDNSLRQIMKGNVVKIARETYNVDVMVERFVRIAKVANINGK